MVMQRKETQTVNRGRGHGEWRNIWRRGRREQGQGTAGKRRWINMFVWIQGLLCEDESSDLALISPMAAQDQIRKQMRWYCGCEHSEFHIQEGEREVQTREGRGCLPACSGRPRRAGPGSGPSVLCGPQACCRAATPDRREPQGDPGLSVPAGRPVVAHTAQELVVEYLLISRDFWNWHFLTLDRPGKNEKILISKGLFFSFISPSPFSECIYGWFVRKVA